MFVFLFFDVLGRMLNSIASISDHYLLILKQKAIKADMCLKFMYIKIHLNKMNNQYHECMFPFYCRKIYIP